MQRLPLLPPFKRHCRRRAQTLTPPTQQSLLQLKWALPYTCKLLLERDLRLQRPLNHLRLQPNHSISLYPLQRALHITIVPAATKQQGRQTCGDIKKAQNTLDKNIFVSHAGKDTQEGTISSNTRKKITCRVYQRLTRSSPMEMGHQSPSSFQSSPSTDVGQACDTFVYLYFF